MGLKRVKKYFNVSFNSFSPFCVSNITQTLPFFHLNFSRLNRTDLEIKFYFRVLKSRTCIFEHIRIVLNFISMSKNNNWDEKYKFHKKTCPSILVSFSFIFCLKGDQPALIVLSSTKNEIRNPNWIGSFWTMNPGILFMWALSGIQILQA